jgi:hypothetical protein
MEGVIISAAVSFFNLAKYSAEKATGVSHGPAPAPSLDIGLSPAMQQETIFNKLQKVNNPTASSSSIDRITSILYVIFWIFIGITAGYLSWDSNSLIGWAPGFKGVFAATAFIFPFYYLLMHFIAKHDLLTFIKKRL